MNSVGAIAANGEYQTLAALYDKDNKLLIPLAATGTGAGVFTLRLYSTVTSTAYISGIGRFYTDAEGTLGEATSMALTANALTTLYVRLASGSAYVLVDNASAIPCFGSPTHGGTHYAFTEATNAPKINGMDISYLKYATAIRIDTNLNLSAIKGSVAGLTALTYLSLIGNLLTCSGSVAGLTSLISLYLSGNLLTCSGSVKELLKKLTNWYINGSGLSIFYETPASFPASIDRYYLVSEAITSSMADQIFIDLAASPVVASGTYKRLAIPSPGGAVSDASLAARNTMTSRGFTVQVHS